MIGEAKAFITRVRASMSKVKDLSRLSEWIIENTTHPKDQTKPWSFTDHEVQLGIANCSKPHAVIRKCSQVGVSELAVRIAIALLDVYPNSTCIYTLPTTSFSRKFAKGRIDPVIAGSTVAGRVPSDNDSSELKQIGGSFLYITGSFGQNSAISVPADILIRDEVDFSNQVALSTFASRLGHAEGGGITRDFSTPTVEGYGISKSFKTSSQARYMVRHDACAKLVSPSFFGDVVVPGYDSTVEKLEKGDLEDGRYDFNGAYIKCPSCQGKISPANLADPDKREWVHEYPDREVAGFQVMPFDVPSVNPVGKTLLHLADYDSKSDWVNFKVGLPFEDAESSFLESVIKESTILNPVSPHELAANGTVAGLDVGKTSWLTIAKRNGVFLDVIYREQIRQDDKDHLTERTLLLMKWFGVQKLVVDANPDFSTVLKLISRARHQQVFACQYVRKSRAPLDHKDVNELEQVINADRTGCFDDLAKMVNKGRVRYAKGQEAETAMKHLGALKRIKSQNSRGEVVANWINTGDDHYGHSLLYLMLADQMCDYKSSFLIVPTLPMAGKVRMQTMQAPTALLR